MGKYDPLRNHLAEQVEGLVELSMTFRDIEALVGPLPRSAWIYRAWWANDSKVQAQSWFAAGWRVQSVDQKAGGVVVFVRGVSGRTTTGTRSVQDLPGENATLGEGPASGQPAMELLGASEMLRRRTRVFLCHASQDKKVTRDLCERLLGAGYDVWFDERNLLPGQDWEYEIRAAVKASDAVVAVLSRNSVNKVGFIQRELRLALDAADERPEGVIFLIPVRLDDAPVPARLAKWQWLDARRTGWFDRLLKSLRAATHHAGHLEVGVVASNYDGIPVAVDLLGLDLNPETITPQQTLILDYRIRLRSEHSLSVVLGASLIGKDGIEHCDRPGDREVALAPETAVYRRRFRISPAVPIGVYQLIGAVWFPQIGGRRMASLDRGFVVRVIPGYPQ